MRMMKSCCACWTLIVGVGFACLLPIASILAAPVQPNILILNSYTRELQWTDNQVQGIMDAYKKAGVEPNFHIEYLDWKKNPTKESLSLLYQLFHVKYAKQTIDIIMTTDDVALEFALTYRKEIFSSAPVVFSGVFPESMARLTRGQRGVTGIQEVTDSSGTLELIKTFKPQLQKIYLIFDNTESGLAAREPLERAVNNLNPKVTAFALNNASYQEIIDLLRTAPDNSAVLMATYSSDKNGVIKELERYVQLFSEHSRIPIFVLYDFEVGSGAVGGSVVSGFRQGQSAAQLGLRILNGENPNLVVAADSPEPVITLDYQQMQRYNLPLNKIPPGSEVINSPQSFYQRNKMIIWTTWTIFCFMAMAIIILILNIRQRRAAEARLKQSNEELTATYEEIMASQEELQAQYEQLEVVGQALCASEERYKLSFDGANDGLWDWDIVNDEVFLSDRCSALLGLDTNKLKGFKTLFASGISSAYITRRIEEHLVGRSDYFICEYIATSTHEDRWLLCRGKALFEGDQPTRMAGSMTDITARKRDEAQINHLAFHDQLTGLWNRGALQEKLDTMLNGASDSNFAAILFIDIDNFKIVNDTYGHAFGDKILVVIGGMLTQIVQDTESYVIRMGGDEFVVILLDINNKTEAAAFAQKICDLFLTPLQVEGNQLYVSFSIGLTLYPDDGSTAEKLLKNADFAMYQAKEQGKNQYIFFDQSMEVALRQRVLLETNLRAAVTNQQLRLWYQPFVQVGTGRIIGFEGLLRWYSADNGIIAPSQFIGLAEKTGLIISIGRQVILDACAFIARLQADGYYNLTVTINISVVQLIEEDFVDSVRAIIAKTGVSPRCLGFEITESVFMEHSKVFIDKLKVLKEMGITILLDDFGSGYSSLKYLDNLPIDVLKIDKSFIDGLNDDGDRKQLVEVILTLARQIHVTAVAEGVETEKQLARLAAYQCEVVQGYLFSKPVPEEMVRSLLGDANQYRLKGDEEIDDTAFRLPI